MVGLWVSLIHKRPLSISSALESFGSQFSLEGLRHFSLSDVLFLCGQLRLHLHRVMPTSRNPTLFARFAVSLVCLVASYLQG